MNKTTKIVLIVIAVIVVIVIVYFAFFRNKQTVNTTTSTSTTTAAPGSQKDKYWNLAGSLTNAFGNAMQEGTFSNTNNTNG